MNRHDSKRGKTGKVVNRMLELLVLSSLMKLLVVEQSSLLVFVHCLSVATPISLCVNTGNTC